MKKTLRDDQLESRLEDLRRPLDGFFFFEPKALGMPFRTIEHERCTVGQVVQEIDHLLAEKSARSQAPGAGQVGVTWRARGLP
jgi:hypothetical protein